ncbi:MAG: ribosome biogenesis GTPase YlqF [Clostridia bacterium]
MIQWFPGHMTKTLREMQTKSKLCDFFVYVLDARAPLSCVNPEFTKVIGDKPIIYVLNKADLANDAETTKWKNYFTTANSKAVVLNATQSKSSQVIIRLVNQIFADRLKANAEKGARFILRGMILGVPNSGKSTLTNNLVGKSRAVTGDKPGVTRNTQWVKLSPSLEIMDTPGTLWPSFTDQRVGYRLALIGSVKDDVVDLYDLVCFFIREYADKGVFNKYGVDVGDKTPRQVLEGIATKRGCIERGGDIDYERAERLIINDFRRGALGKITLDTFDK